MVRVRFYVKWSCLHFDENIFVQISAKLVGGLCLSPPIAFRCSNIVYRLCILLKVTHLNIDHLSVTTSEGWGIFGIKKIKNEIKS